MKRSMRDVVVLLTGHWQGCWLNDLRRLLFLDGPDDLSQVVGTVTLSEEEKIIQRFLCLS